MDLKQVLDDAENWVTHPFRNTLDPLQMALIGAALLVVGLWAFDSVNMVRRIKEGLAQ